MLYGCLSCLRSSCPLGVTSKLGIFRSAKPRYLRTPNFAVSQSKTRVDAYILMIIIPCRSPVYERDDCISPEPVETVTDRLNQALGTSGPGFILSLCQSAQYVLLAPLLFAAPDQEISTVGYPIPSEDGTVDKRAILVVDGAVENGSGHATAISGWSLYHHSPFHFDSHSPLQTAQCPNCNGVKIRHLRVRSTADSQVLMLSINPL